MSVVNLLPVFRRERRAARVLMVRWSIALGAWTALLGVLSLLPARPPTVDEAHAPRSQLDTLAAEELRLGAELDALQRDIAAARRSIDAARATIDHPDWSLLLATIVSLRDERMIFRRWQLDRDPEGGVRLLLEGTTPTIASLTSFAVELERLNVFRRVHLGTAELKAASVTDPGAGLVHFSIDAELTAPRGGERP